MYHYDRPRHGSILRRIAVVAITVGLAGCGASTPDAVGQTVADMPPTAGAAWKVPDVCSELPRETDPTTLRAALDAFGGGFIVAHGRPTTQAEETTLDGKPGWERASYEIDDIVLADQRILNMAEVKSPVAGSTIEAFTIGGHGAVSQYATFFDQHPAEDYLLLIGTVNGNRYRIFGVASQGGTLIPSDRCLTAVPELIAQVGGTLGLDTEDTIVRLVEYSLDANQGGTPDPKVAEAVRVAIGEPNPQPPLTLQQVWDQTPPDRRNLISGEIPSSVVDSVHAIGVAFDDTTATGPEFQLRCDLGLIEYAATDAFVDHGDTPVACKTGTIGLYLVHDDVADPDPIATIDAAELDPAALLVTLRDGATGEIEGSLSTITAGEWTRRTGIDDLASITTQMDEHLAGD